jgi:hypothetical protein
VNLLFLGPKKEEKMKFECIDQLNKNLIYTFYIEYKHLKLVAGNSDSKAVRLYLERNIESIDKIITDRDYNEVILKTDKGTNLKFRFFSYSDEPTKIFKCAITESFDSELYLDEHDTYTLIETLKSVLFCPYE